MSKLRDSTCSLLLLQIYTYLLIFFIMKILTDFRKTVETGMDPRMDLPLALFEQRGSVVP